MCHKLHFSIDIEYFPIDNCSVRTYILTIGLDVWNVSSMTLTILFNRIIINDILKLKPSGCEGYCLDKSKV